MESSVARDKTEYFTAHPLPRLPENGKEMKRL